jgi:hypothetical protein
MKIAIVCYLPLEVELWLQSSRISRLGHEVHFITYSQPVRLALLNPNVHYHEVNVPEYPLFHYQPWISAVEQLVDMVKLYKIEIHVHYAIPRICGYMANKC